MAKCKVVNVCGRRRRLCFVRGKIRSNTAVGAGGKSKRSSHGRAPTKCRKANGQIKKGCRMSKSGHLRHV